MNEASGIAGAKVCQACGAKYPADALFCPNDGQPLQSAHAPTREADDPYLEQEIGGHIVIQQLVGIGAMGRVYRAFQKGIDRDVAVKILHRELSANAQLVSRFTREAKVASRLQHPNVVQVLLAGQLPDRALYMAMEYLDGLSLQSALAAAGGALPMPRAMHIALQLCEAVGEAHQQGIVHRDLKPENVMLVRRGADHDFVKVLDFGIARINWGEQSVATAAGLIFGTARYISPEGAQGNAVSAPSDVYSIATLLYQMLSGRTPFEGDQAVGLLVQQIHDPPPDLRAIARARYVPEPIADVVMTNLAKDPKKREPDARALGHALMDAAKSAGLSTDDISRPLLRRPGAGAMQLPPVERTKQHDLTPDVIERMTPPAPDAKSNGSHPPRAIGAATTKWEPPAEFQARLSDAMSSERTSGVIVTPTPAPSSPRTPGVDTTIDDYSSPQSAPSLPGSVPRTMPGDPDSHPFTHYTPPAPTPSSRPPMSSEPRFSSHPPMPAAQPARSSRTIIFVALCFILGASLAAAVAWRMGRLGAGDDEERFVTRATDAMFKNQFVDPPGENVRDITNEGLRRWPNDKKLVDVRVRAASELVVRAQGQRGAGDISKALELARSAHDLDPNDATAKHLVEQYEAELAQFTAANTPPLDKPASLPKTLPPNVAAAQPYKVLLDLSAPAPRIGQTVDLTARVAPPKGAFDQPAFTITGPSGPVTMPAQSPAPGVYKGTYAFLEGGRFEVAFTTQADGKPLRASRVVVAGAPPPPTQPPQQQPTLPPATQQKEPPPVPPTSPSVKWM